MLKNTTIHRTVLRRIATALGTMNEKVVYVGGATVCLYINDPAADDVRPTKDVDISIEMASLTELEASREELITKGFKQTPEDDVICRFRYDDIKVDVMSTTAIGWAPANPWFGPGFARKETVTIEDQQIQVLPLSYFLASKFTAFNDRGSKDPRTSHDFEDIVYVLDNRTDIVDQLMQSPEDVRPFLKKQFEDILNNRLHQEAIQGNLFYETKAERYERIITVIQQCVSGL